MKKRYMPAFFAAAMLAVALTGCGEKVENQTEKQTEAVTEAVTDAIQIETQPATEPPTEKPTEKQTEKPTEPPTEADVPLTPDEEVAKESSLAAEVTYYASDDINIRETPSTENADNIISSYDKGESIQVVAKTPHWYKVRKSDPYGGEDIYGYVSKDYVSETAIDMNAAEPEQTAPAPEVQEVQEVQPEPQQTTVQVAEGVSGYAESFPITIASDANVRASASESGEVIGVVESGTVVTAVGESGSWYQIDYNGSAGFVHKNLVG